MFKLQENQSFKASSKLLIDDQASRNGVFGPFFRSYGAMTEVLSFLTPMEQLKLQALCAFMYEKGVGRVQISIQMRSLSQVMTVIPSWPASLFIIDRQRRNKTQVRELPIPKGAEMFKGTDWRMAQLTNKKAYLMGGARSPTHCSLLQVTSQEVRVVAKERMTHKRVHHSACPMEARYIVVSGTRQPATSASAVERFDSFSDKWQQLPLLNVGRYRHSSCALFDSVYVFCGMDINAKKLSSIERLNCSQMNEGWRHFNVPILGERIHPAVAPLNNGQIAILGGNDAIWNYLSDCFVWQVDEERIERIAQGNNLAVVPGSIPAVRVDKNEILTIGQWTKTVIGYDHVAGEVRSITRLKSTFKKQ